LKVHHVGSRQLARRGLQQCPIGVGLASQADTPFYDQQIWPPARFRSEQTPVSTDTMLWRPDLKMTDRQRPPHRRAGLRGQKPPGPPLQLGEDDILGEVPRGPG